MLTLKIDESKSAGDFKKEFSSNFPFLKIELFKKVPGQGDPKSHKGNTLLTSNQPINKDALTLHFGGETTVAELKTMLVEKLGIVVQVYRRSGNIWVETSLTDDWSLEKQNHEAEQMNQNLI